MKFLSYHDPHLYHIRYILDNDCILLSVCICICLLVVPSINMMLSIIQCQKDTLFLFFNIIY